MSVLSGATRGMSGLARLARGGALGTVMALLLVPLAACESDDVQFVLVCPEAYIVEEASRWTDYREGDGRDLIDIEFDARISNIDWRCDYDLEAKTVDVQMRFAVEAERGPAAKERSVRIPYFVVVADPKRDILAKGVFGIDMRFEGNVTELGHMESVSQRIRFPGRPDASQYQIYIGFQLTPEALAEIRRKRR